MSLPALPFPAARLSSERAVAPPAAAAAARPRRRPRPRRSSLKRGPPVAAAREGWEAPAEKGVVKGEFGVVVVALFHSKVT